jgi:N-acetylglucosaminyldiphosphoundecaprenol N-acetyl-beta-D-mannosaminyltransferase
MVMEAYDDECFRDIVNGAILAVPDAMPVAWSVDALGRTRASRIRGPDLMLSLCQMSRASGLKIGLYGSTVQVLDDLVANLHRTFPMLDISFVESPPFRRLDEHEVAETARRVDEAACDILFVSLGCPKQERFMARAAPKCRAVMLGVGAAFDFHAGHVRQAPTLVQNSGLEWAFRLIQQPKRLWRRYLYHNPRFMALVSLQILKRLRSSRRG